MSTATESPLAPTTVHSAAPAPSRPALRCAVIGTGVISEEHLRFLSTSERANLVGVCDLSPALAKFSAERFAAESAYTDSGVMLREAKPEVVHVLTPPHTHVALATAALDAGAHVIVEKPAAPTNPEFRKLYDYARERGLRLIEDHNYRFNPTILEIEKLMREGELGEEREVEIRMALAIREPGGRFTDTSLPHPSHNMPAGVIHEFITHLCYLALRFLPKLPPEDWKVSAAWSKYGDEPLFKFDDLDALLMLGKAHGRIRFTSHAKPEMFAITVRGSRGWAETELFSPYLRVQVPRKAGEQLTPLANQWINGASMMGASVRGFRNKIMRRGPYEGLKTFLGQTYAALQEDCEPPVTFEDMDRASKLVDALLANRH